MGFWKCYFDTVTLSSFLIGNINGYDQCILETWASSFPDTVQRDVNPDYIQYENSFFRLNHKVGAFILIFYILMFIGLIKSLLNKNLILSLIFILFYLRMYTADLFFFLPYDFIFYVILIYTNYFPGTVKNKN